MFAIALTIVLYVAAFPFLYGVVRLAVRHGIRDAAEAPRETAVWQEEISGLRG
ncbi:hypothetical protein AB0J86_02350 [Micromonospora sp. NPDC049559]|uniref:hypothetical protein n=1 Tax=Micromonospora sp. NPDC049559 TaxID=3155923 RepID=UPI00342D8CAB